MFLGHGLGTVSGVGDVRDAAVGKTQRHADVIVQQRSHAGLHRAKTMHLDGIGTGQSAGQVDEVAGLPNQPAATGQRILAPVFSGDEAGVHPDVDHAR